MTLAVLRLVHNRQQVAGTSACNRSLHMYWFNLLLLLYAQIQTRLNLCDLLHKKYFVARTKIFKCHMKGFICNLLQQQVATTCCPMKQAALLVGTSKWCVSRDSTVNINTNDYNVQKLPFKCTMFMVCTINVTFSTLYDNYIHLYSGSCVIVSADEESWISWNRSE